MTDIKFARDYGFSACSPFWLIWREDGHYPWFKHETREQAEAEASRLAAERPGQEFHILAVMATVSTSPEVIGTRFDPTRIKLIEPTADDSPTPEFLTDPEFAEVESPATPLPLPVDAHGDDQPF